MTIPRVEVLPIEQGATPDSQNVNKHTQRGGGLLENSLRKRGAFRSIASAGKGADVPVVYAGNYTLQKAVEAGFTEVVNVHVTGNQIVNVVRDDIAPGTAEAIALGLEDNEVGRISYNPDLDILAAVMADPAMQALRAEDKMLADIVEGMGLKCETVDAEPQIDRAAELQVKWQTETGQLWQLGKHRLLVGDCTVRENVERLMGGERAQFTFTDPPYNVGKDYGNETNDNQGKEEYKQWSRSWFTLCKEFTEAIAFTPGAVNVWMWAEIEKPKWMAIWIKTNQVSRNQAGGFNTYEPFLCFGKIKVDYDTWNIPVKQQDVAHPVPKTVEAWQKILSDLIHDYKNIYEPFAGSGTTIIAAQNLSRRCYAMEISPAYCAVILERFATAFPDEEIRLIE